MSIDAGRTTSRRWVHFGLIASAVVSLLFEPVVLSLHIIVGLLFVGLVAAHLAQRRKVSANLLSRLPRRWPLSSRSSRMAVADLLLLAVTVAMFASGTWDQFLQPTRIRWHAITGVVLVAMLVVHTVRRRRRLVSSQVR